MKQFWRCDKCKSEGLIEVPEGVSAVLIIKDAQAAHDEFMPDCDNTLFNIEVADTYWIKKEIDRAKEIESIVEIDDNIGIGLKTTQVHRCLWVWKWKSGEIRCNTCDEPMPWAEVERRLNAAVEEKGSGLAAE